MEDTNRPVDEARLVEWLGVRPEDICFAFLYGSRLYGTARPDSDWDVYVILSDYVGPLAKPEVPDRGIPEILIEKKVGDVMVDVHAVIKSNWQYLLDRNFVPAISSLSLPAFSVIKPFTPGTFRFVLDLMKIKHEADKFKGAHEEISLRLFKQGKAAKGKKILIHPLRVLEYAMQILSKGYVYDFEAANKYKKELDSTNLENQEQARVWLYEKVYHLDEAFRQIVNIYKYHSPINCEPLPIDRYKEIPALLPFIEAAEAAAPPLQVIRDEDADPRDVYIRDYIKTRCKEEREGRRTLSELRLEIAVDSLYLPEPYSHLVQLSLDPNYAPRQSKSVDQSCGLVLDSHGDWRPIQTGAEEQMPLLDWNSAVLTKKLNGITVNLFPFNGEWVPSFYIGNNLAGKQVEWRMREALRKELRVKANDYVDEKEVSQRTYAEIKRIFWAVWKSLEYRLPSSGAVPRCYMFVLQFCRAADGNTQEEVIIDKTAERITAVGARDLNSMTEHGGSELAELAERHGWEHIMLPKFAINATLGKAELVEAVRRYNAIEEKEAKLAQQSEIFKLIQKDIEGLDWMDYEGAVACDAHFRRITFNSKRYESLEKLDVFLPYNQKQRLFYDLLKHLYDDPLRGHRFCASVPQWSSWLLYVQECLDRFLITVDNLYQQVKHIEERKDLARAIARHTKEQKMFLFSLHKGEFSSAVEYWRVYRDQGPSTKALAVAIFEN